MLEDVPPLYRSTRDTLEFRIDDGGFTHFIVWQPDNGPEAIRLQVHPEAPLKGEPLDTLVDQLQRARNAVEQPSLEARYKAFLEAGFR